MFSFEKIEIMQIFQKRNFAFFSDILVIYKGLQNLKELINIFVLNNFLVNNTFHEKGMFGSTLDLGT